MIAATEDALLTTIRQTLGNKVQQTDSLPGGWTQDMLRRALQFAPGVYVSFNGFTPAQIDGAFNGRFSVYVVTKGPHDVQRRRGNARVIGGYAIVELLLNALKDLNVPTVGRITLRGVDNLFRDALFDVGGTVYGIQVELPNVLFEGGTDPSTLDDFMTFDAHYDIDTTNSDNPVAEDHVTLPQ